MNVVDDVSELLRAKLRDLEAALQGKSSELEIRTAELTGLQHSVSTQRKISFCE